ncbi:hypothetical protein QBZ16_003790 [Prototheca wickerhamii]|uniref:Uncharacterized protein n=1 Tax=Prototheca wickerhamii TaxID=3111 RepID=A0AAD9IL13_PROWI|nr:hypothetical protein QBZ16_003790 [Prototheca wickerhamii]
MATEILQQLPQLEAMCTQLYNAQNPQDRALAEQSLRAFALSTDYVPHCRTILDVSASPYAQLMAISSLLKIISEHALSPQIKLDMRSYFLGYLESKGPGLESFVLSALIQLLCRMSKLWWSEDEAWRGLVQDAGALLDRGVEEGWGVRALLGLRLLLAAVTEFNAPAPRVSLTQHRKTAVAFPRRGPANALAEQALRLALACLSFDFVGTCLDESAEDLGTIQVPSAWRAVVEEPGTVQLFWDHYAAHEPPLSCAALECLVRLASVRRSLFGSDAARTAFLARLVEGSRDVLVDRRGLGEQANYHEFCRLLGRLKTNYQLSELVAQPAYADWIARVAEFTVRSLAGWRWSADSAFYLLSLWARLVSSLPYLKGDAPSHLAAFVPRVAEAYVTSRLDAAAAAAEQDDDDEGVPETEEQAQEQLESLPYLFRFRYEDMARALTELMDPLRRLLEGQLAWLALIVGAVLKGRGASAGAAETQEAVDGDLAARGFRLLQALALLSFLQAFRKVFIGEAAGQSTKVYGRLAQHGGPADHAAAVSLTLQKVAANLSARGDGSMGNEAVTGATLDLLKDLATGYVSARILLKLDAIDVLAAAQHRPGGLFSLPACPGASPRALRLRTTFYATLARLLFMEETAARFSSFVAPLDAQLGELAGRAARRGPGRAAARLCARRRRGPHFPAILACLEAWVDEPLVTTPLLKFVNEFALNKSQRLVFDTSSANGILLFRELSKVVCVYGRGLLRDELGTFGSGPVASSGAEASRLAPARSAPVTTDSANVYDRRYKGTWVCLSILSRALTGNYVNFGVFELYGDPALKDALGVAVRLSLAVPAEDLLAYRRLGKAYYALVDALCAGHVPLLASSDTGTFSFFVSSLETGVKSLDVAVSSQCAAAIDSLAGYYFQHTPASGGQATPGSLAIAEHIKARPELFAGLLETLLELVLFEDCTNLWSLTRPVLPLILVNEQVYGQIRARMVSRQPQDTQPHLATVFDKLMLDIQRSLEPRNRDKFTQNFTLARHDFRAHA